MTIGFGRATLAIAFLAACQSAAAQNPGPEVGGRVKAAAQELHSGRLAGVHKVLQPILEEGTAAEQMSADAALVTLGIKQKLADLIVDARVQTSLIGQQKQLKALGPTELPLAVKALADRRALLLAAVDDELALGFRVNVPPAVMDETLARLPELVDQLEPAENLNTALADIAKQVRPPERKRLPADVQAALALNFTKEKTAIKERGGKLADRICELSFVRLPEAMKVLSAANAPYRDRFAAAARVEDCLALLKAHFPKYKTRKGKAEAVAGKDVEIKATEEKFKQVAGQLRLKSWYFEQGKTWWLRGRFGRGGIFDGLGKANPVGGNALALQESLLFGSLQLPDPIPAPQDPLKHPRPLPIARRHMNLWKLGMSELTSDAAMNKAMLSKAKWKLLPAPPGEPPVQLAKVIDWQEPACYAVGYVEYQLALYYWGKLKTLTTKAEWQALEEMLADDDRCAVHSFLSRKYDQLAAGSTLRLDPPRNADPRAKDAFERRGLQWAVALARVELGAMRALYTAIERDGDYTFDRYNETNTNNTRRTVGANTDFTTTTSSNSYYRWATARTMREAPIRPFAAFPPSEIDRQAYAELLWDGVREQYYSLQSQVSFTDRATSSMEDLYAMLRRLSIAYEMTAGYRRLYAASLLPPQVAELDGWIKELDFKLGKVASAIANMKAQLATWNDVGWTLVGGVNNSGGDRTGLQPGEKMPTNADELRKLIEERQKKNNQNNNGMPNNGVNPGGNNGKGGGNVPAAGGNGKKTNDDDKKKKNGTN